MKQKLAINIHSFVDVITNSSTELFVCDTKKSIDEIEEILKQLVKDYNKEVKNGYHSEYATKITYKDAFNKPYIYTKESLERYEKEYANSSWGGWGYETGNTVGKIIISGSGDNSIPYELFDKIENLFSGHSYHLG